LKSFLSELKFYRVIVKAFLIEYGVREISLADYMRAFACLPRLFLACWVYKKLFTGTGMLFVHSAVLLVQ